MDVPWRRTTRRALPAAVPAALQQVRTARRRAGCAAVAFSALRCCLKPEARVPSDSKNNVVTNNHATGAGGNQIGIQVSSDSSDVISGNVADYIQVSGDTNSTIKGNTVDEGGLYSYNNHEVDVENNHEKNFEGALPLACVALGCGH